MGSHLQFNERNTDDYLNDKRNFSFKFLIPVLVFALMIFLVVYFARKSNEKDMIDALNLMINDLEEYIENENIKTLDSLVTYEKF